MNTRKYICLSFILSFLFTFVACQPTPESKPVIGKSENSLQSLIENTAKPTAAVDKETDSVDENVVVDRWTKKIETGKATIEIDADIIRPSSNCVVLKVVPRDFTQEDVKKAIELFAGDAQMSNYTLRSKGYIENQILKYRRYIAEIEAGTFYIDEGKTAEEQIEEFEKEIAELENEYLTAPESVTSDAPANINFVEDKINGGVSINLFFLNKNQEEKLLEVQNNAEESETCLIFTDKDKGLYEPLTESEKETAAKELPDIDAVNQFVSGYFDKLKIGQCRMQSCEIASREMGGEKTYIYSLDYSKDYGNGEISFLDLKPVPLDSNNVNEDYYPPLGKEEIEVITDGKTIYVFWWLMPYSVLEEVNSNVETIELDKMKSLMENQITRIAKGEDIEEDIKISQVKMSCCYLQIPNERTYLVIPVWDMIGTETSEYNDGQNIMSFVTLNAIDGTVIDRDLGY